MLFVLATDSVRTSDVLCSYLRECLDADDEVHAVNSKPGGDSTDADEIRAGEDALEVVEENLRGVVRVETHQYVRGNDPVEDVLGHAEEVGADELVMGIRKRNPTAKIVFGSVAQDLLLRANLPMRVVPRESV
ncbi:universal stress protein [Halorarum halophilum]|uniref:Universal stress protein n=1 Tax=Halorarum halophilum TaxID=2743090 RepID=A0A7D5GXD7_9EURY|nr:universal stress protein [Halobaculum halophilum]QLG26153.1 universal stress protein [Halobaculum halophilum]